MIMSYFRQPDVVRTEKTVDPAEKIFIDGDNKNVAVTVIYTKDGLAFTYDAAGKKNVAVEDLFALFINGVVAVKNDVYYKPTSCTKAGVITFPFPA